MMKDDMQQSIDELLISRYVDGIVNPEERKRMEEQLKNSIDVQTRFRSMQVVSELVKESNRVSLTEEEKAAFDARLKRRIEAEPVPSGFWVNLYTPIRTFRSLSWQWQATLALCLVILCYIPVLMQSAPVRSNLNLLIESDLSNSIFQSLSIPGSDFIWVVEEEDTEKDEKEIPKDESKEEDKSPLGYTLYFRA